MSSPLLKSVDQLEKKFNSGIKKSWSSQLGLSEKTLESSGFEKKTLSSDLEKKYIGLNSGFEYSVIDFKS